MMNIIQVSNISYNVKQKEILTDINFQVQQGDYFALLGENGSGKSTLIDVILDDLKANSGSVSFFEKTKKNFSKVAIVYDQLPVFPMLKVDEIINYFCTIHKLNSKDIKEKYYDIFNLRKIKNSFIRELSQGEKKKVSLILSILKSSELLILDEPFANLDPTIIDTLWDVLKEKSKTIFFTSHNWREVETMANKVCFIYQGKILQKPLSPTQIINTLPATKKIAIENDYEILKTFKSYDYFIHDKTVHFFYDEKSDLLNEIRKKTSNYSIQNIGLKDAYLYYISLIKKP
jgi:ABC-2 type transport system ATP-binding protein